MTNERREIIVVIGRGQGYGGIAEMHRRMKSQFGKSLDVEVNSQTLAVRDPYQKVFVSKVAGGIELSPRNTSSRLKVLIIERPDYMSQVSKTGSVSLNMYTIFELDSLLEHQSEGIAIPETIAVPTDHHAVVVTAALPTVKPIIIPIPRDRLAEKHRQLLRRQTADRRADMRCRCLTIMSTTERRDVAALLGAFNSLCDSGLKVSLTIKISDRREDTEAVNRALDYLPELARESISVVKGRWSAEKINELYAHHDLYVSVENPSGWDLPLRDARDVGMVTVSPNLKQTEPRPEQRHLAFLADLSREYVKVESPYPNSQYQGNLVRGIDENTLAESWGKAVSALSLSSEFAGSNWYSGDKNLDEADAMDLKDLEPLPFNGDWLFSQTEESSPDGVRTSLYLYRSSTNFRTEHEDKIEIHKRRLLQDTVFFGGILSSLSGSSGLRKSNARDFVSHARSLPSKDRGTFTNLAVRLKSVKSIRDLGAVARTLLSTRKYGSDLVKSLIYHRSRFGDLAEMSTDVTSRVKRVDQVQTEESNEESWMKDRKSLHGFFTTIPVSAKEIERLSTVRTQVLERRRSERIYVLGNAPSLKKVKWEVLTEFDTFAANRISLLFDETTWRPTFYTAVDWLVAPRSWQEFVTSNSPLTCAFLPNRFRGLVDGNPYWFSTRPLLNDLVPDPVLYPKVGFPSHGTVVTSAISIAAFLGYTDIRLVGVDCSYVVLDTVEQSGPKKFDTGNRLYLRSTKDDDPNHFDPRYFGAGEKWHDPNPDAMKMAIGNLAIGLQQFGVTVTNASPYGELDTITRISDPIIS